MPASTVAVRSRKFTSRTRFIRDKPMTIASPAGIAPPEREVPTPRNHLHVIFTAKFKYSANFRRCSRQYNSKRHGTIGSEGIRFEGAKTGFIAYDGIRLSARESPVRICSRLLRTAELALGIWIEDIGFSSRLMVLPTRYCGCIAAYYIDTGTLSFVM